jgi:hypothetical protein
MVYTRTIFFVMNRIASNEVKVSYCPTGNMLANFFTKRVQGTPSCKLSNVIMNVDPQLIPKMDHRSVVRMKDKNSTSDWIKVQAKKQVSHARQ